MNPTDLNYCTMINLTHFIIYLSFVTNKKIIHQFEYIK